MSKKATIIAVVNQKGGTGKTTTTENLGVGLALEGKKVLLVDTDPQASLTVSLGNPCPDDLSPTLSDLMGKIMMENPITPDEGILHHPEGVDLVPSNIELSGMEVALVNAMSRETILRQYLDTVKQNYDYILLDCMPCMRSSKRTTPMPVPIPFPVGNRKGQSRKNMLPPKPVRIPLRQRLLHLRVQARQRAKQLREPRTSQKE